MQDKGNRETFKHTFRLKKKLLPLVDKISLLLHKYGEVRSGDFSKLQKLAALHELSQSTLLELIEQAKLTEIAKNAELGDFVRWVERVNKATSETQSRLSIVECKHLIELAPANGLKTKSQLMFILFHKAGFLSLLSKRNQPLKFNFNFLMLLALVSVMVVATIQYSNNHTNVLNHTSQLNEWQAAKQKNTLTGFQQYLENWPDGKFELNAKRAITYLYNQQKQIKVAVEQRRKENIKRVKSVLSDLGYSVSRSSELTKENKVEIRGILSANNLSLDLYSDSEVSDLLIVELERLLDSKDNLAWQNAVEINTEEAYENYLTSFVNGQYRRNANVKKDEIVSKLALQKIQKEKALRKQQNTYIEKALSTLFSSFVSIPAGNEIIGCSKAPCKTKEKPAHQVAIKAFKMMSTEVTFSMWNACVIANGCNYSPDDHGWGKDNRPVIMISFQDITEEFIPWLNQISGKRFSLPSEAQWEYVLRADFDVVDCTSAHFGQFSGECGNQRQTLPVKSFPANTLGIHDLQGNVWEWAQDCWNDNFQGAPINSAPWLEGQCEARVLRGGSWLNKLDVLRPSARKGALNTSRNNDVGFRLVLNN